MGSILGVWDGPVLMFTFSTTVAILGCGGWNTDTQEAGVRESALLF